MSSSRPKTACRIFPSRPISIATGEVVAGYAGTQNRACYTLVGTVAFKGFSEPLDVF